MPDKQPAKYQFNSVFCINFSNSSPDSLMLGCRCFNFWPSQRYGRYIMSIKIETVLLAVRNNLFKTKQKKHSKNHFLTHWECVMPAELTFARASALEMSLTYIALMCWKRNLPKHLWLRRIMLCTSKLEEIWWARQKERSQPKLMILLTLSSFRFLWQLC